MDRGWHGKTTPQGRRGQLMTRRGVIETPFFMPDATRASVRGITSEDALQIGTTALVVNTYHLFLQPGAELIARAGGIHAFMHWEGPILSDSGGYQVFSLIHKHPGSGRIDEEGALFRAPLTGEKHTLTPEDSILIQFELGVDMMVCFDDPRPNTVSRAEMEESVERTLRWAKRCKQEFAKQVQARGFTEDTRPLLFGVVQGGKEKDLRQHCARELAAIGFDGYGFGGRHVDEEGKFLTDIVTATAEAIPEDSARFALGVGKPEDIVRFHQAGWDMFDCVIPTREGRHGRLFLEKPEASLGDRLDFYTTINITNERFRDDFTPVDPHCDCELCQNYTRSYLRHLFAVGEPLAPRLASTHNLHFYLRLMRKLQENEEV